MTSKWVWVGAAAVAAGIALLLVDRLDGQSLAFVAGAICGVAGSVPTAAVLFWFYQRQAPPPRATEARERPPQVVMMPSVQQPFLAGTPASFTAPPFQRPQREFTIVGEQEGEDDGNT